MNLTKLVSFLCLTPPGLNLLLLLFSYAVLLISPRSGRKSMFYSILIFYLMTTPFFMLNLAKFIENIPVLTEFKQKADAIVLLGGGRLNTPEYGKETLQPEPFALQRLQYAAYLHKKTNLPIIASGGVANTPEKTESHLYATLLQDIYHIKNVTEDNQSRTTHENARSIRKTALRKNINTIYLVTNAFHMARAKYIFEKAGLTVIPASTGFFSKQNIELHELFLPSSIAFMKTQLLMGEVLGRAAYWFIGKTY